MTHAVDLSALIGLRTINARGEFVGAKTEEWHDAAPHIVVLRLDGTLYWFQEDPSGGYRSMLSHVRVAQATDIPIGSLSEFPPRVVNCWLRTVPKNDYGGRDEVLVGVDEATDTILFEIGTVNLDDYYPSFISEWNPPEVA